MLETLQPSDWSGQSQGQHADPARKRSPWQNLNARQQILHFCQFDIVFCTPICVHVVTTRSAFTAVRRYAEQWISSSQVILFSALCFCFFERSVAAMFSSEAIGYSSLQ